MCFAYWNCFLQLNTFLRWFKCDFSPPFSSIWISYPLLSVYLSVRVFLLCQKIAIQQFYIPKWSRCVEWFFIFEFICFPPIEIYTHTNILWLNSTEKCRNSDVWSKNVRVVNKLLNLMKCCWERERDLNEICVSVDFEAEFLFICLMNTASIKSCFFPSNFSNYVHWMVQLISTDVETFSTTFYE